MSHYPYAPVPRATTPPLYYRRPEGAAPAYYSVPARGELSSLHIPTAAAAPSAPPYAVYHQSSVSRSSVPQVPVPPSPRSAPYAMPSVANPFEPMQQQQQQQRPIMPEFDMTYAQQLAGRWSVQQDAGRLAALDAEEAALAADEAVLKAQSTELKMLRRRQEEDQLRLSAGWSALLEREERYYTEPVPDLSQDIMAREHQCAAIHEQLQQAEGHLAYQERQLEASAYVLQEKEAVLAELKSVREGFEAVELRRRQCVAKCERFFDVECKRNVECARAVRKLDGVLKDMADTGLLAQLQMKSASPSQARCVTFAEKSIVLDIGSHRTASSSLEPSGLTENNNTACSDATAPYSYANNIGASGSVCIGMDEEDIGGTSVAFSLNNTSGALKRYKLDVPQVA